MAPIRRSRRLEQRVADAQEEEVASATTAAVEATTAPPAKKSKTTKKLAAAASTTRAKKAITLATSTTDAIDADGDTTAAKKSSGRKKPPNTTTATAATTTKASPKKAKATTTANAKGKARATTTTTMEDTDVVMKSGDGTGGDKTTAYVGGGEEATEGDETAPKTKRKAKAKGKGKAKADDDTTAATAAAGEEQEGKPKAKRGRKSKADTVSTTAEVTGDAVMAATATIKKVQKTKNKGKGIKKEDEDASAKPASTGSAGRKKRKANPEDGDDSNERSGTAGVAGAASLTQSGTAAKKQKTAGKKLTAKATTTLTPAATTLTNKSDPYAALPTELWQEVMSYLALSQIAKVSTVSKGWLEGTRALHIWRDACVKAGLGKPAQKYPTHMSLVCSQSFWICEQCLKLNAGRGSEIPMPVEIAELGNERRMLCRECRCKYYKKHPEKVETRKDRLKTHGEYVYDRMRLTKTDACDAFCLRDEDLWELPCEERENPHYRNAAPMRLYEEEDVIGMALRIHGGYIGLKAARNSIAKARREAFKKRSQQAQTRVLLKTGKKSKEHQLQEQHLQAVLQKLAQDPAELEKAVASYMDCNAQTWLKVISRDSSRTEIKEAIAEAEARVAAGEPTLVIKSTTPDKEWIDNIRNSVNGDMVKRAGIRKIIEKFEAGMYDKTNASTTAASSGLGSGSSSTGTAGPAGGAASWTLPQTLLAVVAQQ